MAKADQPEFSLRDYHNDPEYEAFRARLSETNDIESLVLFSHVFIHDQLRQVMGMRLRADTLPSLEHMPQFMDMVHLALAGSEFQDVRQTLVLLNQVRNKIAHHLDRKDVKAKLGQLYQRLPTDEPWPKSSEEQVDALRVALSLFFVQFALHISRCASEAELLEKALREQDAG